MDDSEDKGGMDTDDQVEVQDILGAVGQDAAVGQDVPAPGGQALGVQVQVQSERVEPVRLRQPRRGLRSQITLGEEIL